MTCLFAVACTRVKFSLRFMVDDTIYATVSTNGNEAIQMPKDPVKADYTFDGWYWDKDVWKNQFTANSLMNTPLSSNMEVYAHFVDESYLKGTDINIKTAEKVNVEGVGEVFYLTVRNNQLVCKFNDYVEINPHSSWILTKDINGNEPITSKTITLEVGDNPLYYIYVTDKNDQHDTYIVLVHRNRMFSVSFNSNGGSQCPSQEVEEGFYLENIPTTTRRGYEFASWDYDFKNNPIKGNVNAKAIWTANQYTITYNPNNGYVSNKTQIVTYDQRYTLEVPTRNGYKFRGWKYNGNYFDNSGTWSLEQNIVLTADWEIIYYSVTYELNGGSSSSISLRSSYTINDTFTIPSPFRTGYTFKGWSMNENLSNAKIDYKVEQGTTGNLKFYAKWEGNQYLVTYDVNGGDPLANDTQQVTFGQNTALAEPTRTGYNFAGWYNNSSKVNNGEWNIAKDVTLSAKWEAIQYPIRYELDGGTNDANNPYNYTIESETITLGNPQKEGYTFTGWTGEGVDSPAFALSIPHGSTGEKSFAAHWGANTYTVTYDVNGGNPIADNVKDYIFDSNVALLETTRPGYVFAGWYYGEKLVTSGPWKIADNATLVARWSIVDFNVQYNLNNGNNDQANPASYTYDDETITLNDATRTGYTFLGWTSAEVSTPTKGIQIVHNSTGDKLFTANWQANTYTVTFDVNGGNEIEKTIEEVIFDEEVILVSPTRTGYTFSGWYEGNTLFESGKWTTPKDVDLVAKWTPNNYTITKENGSGAGTSTVTYDANYNLGTSEKTGYEFTGWFTSMYGQGTQYTDANGDSLKPYVDTNGQTLFASFVYHITFVSNGGSYVPELTLYENECLSDTIVSEKENRTFAGWFTDPELTNPVSYSQPLGNITLYAKWAEEVEPTQLTYSLSSGCISISGTSFAGSDLVLPSYIGGNPVNTILSNAFAGKSSFASVEVPKTVISIGRGAFRNCASLINVSIPFVGQAANKTSGYESVFGYIFDYGSSTSTSTTQYFNGGSSYFYIPSTIKNVTITVQTSFAQGAFYNCKNIEVISIPSNTTSLGSQVFYNCSGLKRLNSNTDGLFNIPTSVENIKASTFYNCSGAIKITLSSNVTSVGDYAFSGCKNVTQFNSDNDGKLIVPASCQTIGNYAFAGMNKMTDLIVPESVTSIGRGAFNSCNSLVNLTIPFVGQAANKTSGYESVFGYIFDYGSSTSTSTTQYFNGGSSYFYIPSTIKNVTITVQTSFAQGAFYNCKNIETITMLKDANTSATNCLYNCNATINKTLDVSPTAPWNGSTISNGFSSGSGVQEDPYVINSASELAYLAQQVNNGNSFAGVYFVLANDLNLNSNSMIIGDSNSHPFSGIINGNGHVIRNLSISSSNSYVGLFGYFDGLAYDLGIESLSITANSTEESVYGGAFGYVSLDGVIHDVYATGSISITGQTYAYAGGLVGYCEGTITNSYSRCNVSCTCSGYMAYAGGFVGYLKDGSIANCFATGNVSAKGATSSYSRNGGFIGFNDNGTLNNCYRSSSQTLTRFGISGSAYNDDGTAISFGALTGNEIIELFGWSSDVWDGSNSFPTLK